MSTDQQSRFSIIIHKGGEHQKQWMLCGQMLEVIGAVIVHYDFLELSSPEQLFALASGRKIGESGLSQLQSASVETIRAVDVDSAAYMIDVVQYKRSAVQNHRRNGGGSLETRETLSEIAGSDDAGLAQHQLAMKGAVFRAGTVGQTDGLQFATLRSYRQVLMMMKMMKMVMMMMMVIVEVVEATTVDVVVVVVAVRFLVDNNRGRYGGVAVVIINGGGDRRCGWRGWEGTRTRSWLAQAAVQHKF